MSTQEFLTQLNDAEKGWGLWINRDNLSEHHVGQYAFENDRMSKSFVHAGSLEELTHLRQKYILQDTSKAKSAEVLGREWAENFLAQWRAQWLVEA